MSQDLSPYHFNFLCQRHGLPDGFTVLQSMIADLPVGTITHIHEWVAPDHEAANHYVLGLHRLWQPESRVMLTRPALMDFCQQQGWSVLDIITSHHRLILREVLPDSSPRYWRGQAMLRHAPSTAHYWLQPDDYLESFWQHQVHITLHP